MTARFTTDNPGAFRSRTVRGPRAIASRTVRNLREGAVKQAALGALADVVNLFEAKAAPVLKPRFICPCCDTPAHAFHHVLSRGISWNAACPTCDSRSRHRGLSVLLPERIAQTQTASVLHFAPEAVLRRCFDVPDLTYETADLLLEDVTYRKIDLQQLPFPDRAYDMVVCNHVLEHLPEDGAALREIKRVVRKLAVITVPGDFSRRETLHYEGELVNGHYRDYGTDFEDRLLEFFPQVEVVDLHGFDRSRSGLSLGVRERDLAFLCLPS